MFISIFILNDPFMSISCLIKIILHPEEAKIHQEDDSLSPERYQIDDETFTLLYGYVSILYYDELI